MWSFLKILFYLCVFTSFNLSLWLWDEIGCTSPLSKQYLLADCYITCYIQTVADMKQIGHSTAPAPWAPPSSARWSRLSTHGKMVGIMHTNSATITDIAHTVFNIVGLLRKSMNLKRSQSPHNYNYTSCNITRSAGLLVIVLPNDEIGKEKDMKICERWYILITIAFALSYVSSHCLVVMVFTTLSSMISSLKISL